jgi:hypothetical protein
MPIAVVRAETYYLPPRPLPTDAWKDVPPAELAYHWVEFRTGRRVPLPDGFVENAPPVFARVNQNRWCADCVCGSAAAISPQDPRWGCTECGYGWAPIIVPTKEEAAAIEAELLTIPQPHLRNWWNPDDPSNPYRPPEEEPNDESDEDPDDAYDTDDEDDEDDLR